MPRDNIADFNLCAGLIFSQTLAAFPNEIFLDKKAICEVLLNKELQEHKQDAYGQLYLDDSEHEEALKFVNGTGRWLVDEGYLRSRSQFHEPGAVTLTQNGFYILGTEALTSRGERLGRKLSENVEAGMWDAVREVTSDVLLAGIKLGWQELIKAPGSTS
ncbi:hypothetical protein [Halomonas campaniensis]|uniref:Uncharacterized protein n=1 Tax=Halomonas campaniensis TaxID=213554 RepID=A0A246RVC4_9GAMM|nr:hypothetical protein [Halomonas campaniensis]OWV28104.1 hypothetical protein JI62_17310 [Halomonas campaniensis]